MDFIAFDFETANASRNSAVSLALTVVRNDQIVDEFYSLLNPHTDFHWRNVQIHGIRATDVIDAPTFSELWPVIAPFFAPDKLVIAHNAPFDNSVLKASLAANDISLPSYQSLDTVRVAKKAFPNLSNHKLNTVAEYLQIPLDHHHNALDDSVAAANILLQINQQFGAAMAQPFIKLV
ncbi:3'-5' exonuclease [Periweissella ghanensis]|uniref:DNA polymerase III PolC-type n=1 Tax=Periweissella ghanensis TaxID=467997 RepID=A0ABM8ZB68_9LACO|nr:3'-5' exonuclease [Periweissella ghanensis]MCM0601796.1 3'-5' exonuclease [Periweissella ghanensis]CAH0418783.1 DNA polymerase III PolC-type [Periweissella ghanensis]